MATKKVTELTHADLGKNVVIDEPNGDRNTGVLKSVSFATAHKHVSVSVDNAIVNAPLDADVQFTD